MELVSSLVYMIINYLVYNVLISIYCKPSLWSLFRNTKHRVTSRAAFPFDNSSFLRVLLPKYELQTQYTQRRHAHNKCAFFPT